MVLESHLNQVGVKSEWNLRKDEPTRKSRFGLSVVNGVDELLAIGLWTWLQIERRLVLKRFKTRLACPAR